MTQTIKTGNHEFEHDRFESLQDISSSELHAAVDALPIEPSAPDSPTDAQSAGTQTDCPPDFTRDISRLEGELEEAKAALLRETAHSRELQERLNAMGGADGKSDKTARGKNSFDIVLELSSERESALRERKMYKERAESAEAQVADLESDLSAAYAKAKLQEDRAKQLAARCEELQRNAGTARGNNTLKAQPADDQTALDGAAYDTGNESVASLKRLLAERDSKIAELEMQLVDRAGTPTMFGGELEQLVACAIPSVVYVLDSLDTPGVQHKLTRPTNTVGRSKDNDIQLESSSVSRYHARLVQKPDGVWLMDMQSVNGCKVNGRRTSGQILSDGDWIAIGDCRFRFSAMTA